MAKVTAFTCGVRNGNCEILVKEALMAMEQLGVEVEMIRLNDCDLKVCKGCPNGPCGDKGPEACILKDDGAWLTRKFFESDAYILAAPVWSLAPTGIVSVFRDRVFGYNADIAGWEKFGIPQWAPKEYMKHRPGALISVGGASTRHWTSLSMATLYTTSFSTQTNIVDQMDVYEVAGHGEIVLYEEHLARARELGANLAYALNHPEEDWSRKRLGDVGNEACPGCRTSLVIARPGTNFVECAICGRKGYVTMEDGTFHYTWPEDPQDRLTLAGKHDHMNEIQHHGATVVGPNMDKIKEGSRKYAQWNDCVVTPPSRQK